MKKKTKNKTLHNTYICSEAIIRPQDRLGIEALSRYRKHATEGRKFQLALHTLLNKKSERLQC